MALMLDIHGWQRHAELKAFLDITAPERTKDKVGLVDFYAEFVRLLL